MFEFWMAEYEVACPADARHGTELVPKESMTGVACCADCTVLSICCQSHSHASAVSAWARQPA